MYQGKSTRSTDSTLASMLVGLTRNSSTVTVYRNSSCKPAPHRDSSHTRTHATSQSANVFNMNMDMNMKDTVQLLYTASFSPASRSQLESILSAACQYIQYEPLHDPVFEGLSPCDLFKCRNFSFSNHYYALVADSRTLSELHSHMTPSVLVVSVRPLTAQREWEQYNGPGDLSLLQPNVRLALLRAMAEERAALDPHTEAWFWVGPNHPPQYTDTLWQIKTVRADPAGANYALSFYSVKDMDDMHRLVNPKPCGHIPSLTLCRFSVRRKLERPAGFSADCDTEK
ncbi:hypothetical protein DFH07DRAFT_802747 [Mycena maculata]|uniref:Uncharacterized protein n=1 Tax=Mycena maculata TaxID=230809 RepID=A0AAD7JVE1_9AGAR|nr:hypothetical protein DFH07DRAFT_802747 [Mycena maculata]